MKQTILFMVICLPFLACTRTVEVEPADRQKQEITFTAYSAETDTKTARQSDNVSVYWSPAEAISIFFISGENGGNRFVSQNTEEVAKTQFRGTIDVFTGGGESEGGDFWFWGIYPYSGQNSCDGTSITTVIPANQVGKAGTFADNTFVTMARSHGLSLAFYNICSGVKFTLTRDDVKTVSIRGNGGEEIAGKVKAVWDENGKPAVVEYVEGEKEVIVTAPGGGTFGSGTDYYLVFTPKLFSEGFTMSLTTSGNQQGSFVYGKSRQFMRGIFVVVSNLDTRVTSWEPLPVTSLSLSKTSVSLKVSETATLSATVKPDYATVTWSSSDETIVSVFNGVITACKAGNATITAESGDKSATCAVKVSDSSTGIGDWEIGDNSNGSI